MTRRRPDGGDFFGAIARRVPPLRLVERTAHPRRHGEPLAALFNRRSNSLLVSGQDLRVGLGVAVCTPASLGLSPTRRPVARLRDHLQRFARGKLDIGLFQQGRQRPR
jgi:hypothetical protein